MYSSHPGFGVAETRLPRSSSTAEKIGRAPAVSARL